MFAHYMATGSINMALVILFFSSMAIIAMGVSNHSGYRGALILRRDTMCPRWPDALSVFAPLLERLAIPADEAICFLLQAVVYSYLQASGRLEAEEAEQHRVERFRHYARQRMFRGQARELSTPASLVLRDPWF